MSILTPNSEYQAAIFCEYQGPGDPAAGSEERAAYRPAGSPPSPLVENSQAAGRSSAMNSRRAVTLSERVELQSALRAGETQAGGGLLNAKLDAGLSFFEGRGVPADKGQAYR